MYVKNVSKHSQQFRSGGTSFLIKPDATVSMTKEEVGDHTAQFLLARGILKLLSDDEGLDNVIAQAEEQQAKAEENKLEVNIAGEDTTKQVIMVQCAATKKNGERCLNNVSVKLSEYSEDEPYFCGTHRNESAADYEKADGTWRKRLFSDEPQGDEIAEALVEATEEQ